MAKKRAAKAAKTTKKAKPAAKSADALQMKLVLAALIGITAILVVIFVVLPALSGGVNPQNDSDGDGIINAQDSCLNTPTGEQVDQDGCAVSVEDCGNEVCAGTESCDTCIEDCLNAGEVCCNDVAFAGSCCTDYDCIGAQVCRPDNTCGAELKECEDGLDNDGNGCADYPLDWGCDTLDDDYESGGTCYCIDTDGGKEYDTVGVCGDLNAQIIYDSCIDTEILSESYCITPITGADPFCSWDNYHCPTGFMCSEGACVASNITKDCSWESIATIGNRILMSETSRETITTTGLDVGQYQVTWDIVKIGSTYPDIVGFSLIEYPGTINDRTDYGNTNNGIVYFNDSTGAGSLAIEITNFNEYSVFYTVYINQWLCDDDVASGHITSYEEESATGSCYAVDISGLTGTDADTACTTLGGCMGTGECLYNPLGDCTCRVPVEACGDYEIDWTEATTSIYAQGDGLSCDTGECTFNWDVPGTECQGTC
ncbi:MAG: hypothetical protein ACXABY_14860, partial [Candidatus Thorarchaeota archaeon]